MTQPEETKDTINKSLLLNWLYASDKNLPIEELKRWLEGNTIMVPKNWTTKTKKGDIIS